MESNSMGWRGAVRSLQAAARAAERDRQRYARQQVKAWKEYERALERAEAAEQVEAYQERIEALTSIHKETSTDLLDWEAILKAPVPTEPALRRTNEIAALRRLGDYKPTFTDKLFRREESKHYELEKAVKDAVQQDAVAHARAIGEYRAAVTATEADRDLARRVLAGEPSAFAEVLERFDPFSEISYLGSSIKFSIERDDNAPAGAGSTIISATVHVHAADVIPRQVRSLLKSGKLSIKEMPASQFHALHQDYVCGTALRVANELLALLPVTGVFVTAQDHVLNTSTGHMEEQPILSLYAPRETLERMNLPAVDASDSMVNFLHRMSFKKTTGFMPVQQLSVADIRQAT